MQEDTLQQVNSDHGLSVRKKKKRKRDKDLLYQPESPFWTFDENSKPTNISNSSKNEASAPLLEVEDEIPKSSKSKKEKHKSKSFTGAELDQNDEAISHEIAFATQHNEAQEKDSEIYVKIPRKKKKSSKQPEVDETSAIAGNYGVPDSLVNEAEYLEEVHKPKKKRKKNKMKDSDLPFGPLDPSLVQLENSNQSAQFIDQNTEEVLHANKKHKKKSHQKSHDITDDNSTVLCSQPQSDILDKDLLSLHRKKKKKKDKHDIQENTRLVDVLSDRVYNEETISQSLKESHEEENKKSEKDQKSLKKEKKSKDVCNSFGDESQLLETAVTEKLLEIADLEDDLAEDFLNFEIPPLHAKESVAQLSEDDKEELAKNGVQIRVGKWLKKETGILLENWKEFLKHYNLRDPSRLLGLNTNTQEKKIISNFVKKKHFYVRLGKDLTNRSLNTIYRRARQCFTHYKTEQALNEDEVRQIAELRDAHNYNWSKISEHLEKSTEKCRSSYRSHKKHQNQKVWSEAEDALLKKAVADVCGKDLNKSAARHSSTPWTKVAKIVYSRNAFQCREHWLHTLFPPPRQTELSKWSHKESACLIVILHRNKVKDEVLVNWEKIFQSFGYCTRSYAVLMRKWLKLKRKVPQYKRLSYRKILKYLHGVYLQKKMSRHNWTEETLLEFLELKKNFYCC